MDQQGSTNHILLTARLEERNSENSKISHNSKTDGLEEGIRGNYKKNRKRESLEGTVEDPRVGRQISKLRFPREAPQYSSRDRPVNIPALST